MRVVESMKRKMFLESKTMREREIEIKSQIENGKIDLSIYLYFPLIKCKLKLKP